VSKGVQIAVGATAIAALLGWYGLSNLDAAASFRYYQSLDDFRAAPEALAGENARVHGYVALGSIERDVPGKRVRFAVQNTPPHAGGEAGAPLTVVFASLETPDLFKDGAEIVLEGRLAGAGSDAVFHADRLMAKCPSKFDSSPTQSASF